MKKYLLFFMTVVLVFCLPTLVLAQIEINAQVDKNSLATDESLTYKLIITSGEKNVPSLKFPKFEGFNIISQAESSTISFVKSDIKNILVYVFILAPKQPGEFKIQPSQIKFKDKTYQTEAFDIEVKLGRIEPPEPSKQEPTLPQEQPEEQPQKIIL